MALRKWSFEKVCLECLEGLQGTRRLTAEVGKIRPLLIDSPSMQISRRLDDIGMSRFCEAMLLLLHGRVSEAWPRLHLQWRYKAVAISIRQASRTQQIVSRSKEARFGTLPLQRISCDEVTHLLMTMAFSVVLGEDKVADSLGQTCYDLWHHPPIGMEEDSFSLGTVAPWLLAVYCIWRNQQLSLADKDVVLKGPFASILAHWDDDVALETDVFQLCELHAKKAVNLMIPNNDFIFGLVSDFPSEVLFLQRVRRELGLSVPAPEHPLLESPLAKVPFPCLKSGYDEILDEACRSCQRQLPQLKIEWEDDFQKLGPSDPRSLPLTDLDIVRAKS